ncbi:MAG: GEVED domain-containing protein [Weeksellaceae bacterium]|nr:GEVED domain-containing protein [Weeksellaceae bacterium]
MKSLSTLFTKETESPRYLRNFIVLPLLLVLGTGVLFGQNRETKTAAVKKSQSVQINKTDNSTSPKKINSDELIQRKLNYDNKTLERLKAEKQNQSSRNDGLNQGKPIERRIESSEAKGGSPDNNGAVVTENQNQSPFESVKGKREDVSKRDLYSKTYQNEDGSFTALIGAGPIHYQKNGQFLDIDHKITQNFDQTYPFVNATNLFQSYFGATSHTGLKNKTDDGELREFLNTKMFWEVNGQPYGLINSANTPIQIEGDKAYYRNIYGNIDVEFTMLTGKRELNYIIPNQAALGNIPENATYLVFSEDVVLPIGWTHEVTDKGIVIKNTLGQSVYLYSNPVSKDAKETLFLSKENNTIYETRLIGNTLTVLTKVKTEWLLSSERVFPVMVDPTVNATPDNINRWSISVYDNGNENVTVGYFGLVGNIINHRWLQYHIRFNATSIPTNAIFTYVEGYVNIWGYGGDPHPQNHWAWANSANPVNTFGPNLYNSATTLYSDPKFIGDLSGGWNRSPFTYPNGINYLQSQFNNNGRYINLAVVPVDTYNINNFYAARNHTNGNDRPYLKITYHTDPNNPEYCQVQTLTNPVNELYIRDTRFLGTLNPTDVVNLNNGYANGYQNFSNLWAGANKPTQAQGQGINVHAQLNPWRGRFKAWVDWNKNGVFEEATELVYDTEEVATNAALFGFVIPQNQAPGDYRIRIRVYNRWIDFYNYDTGVLMGSIQDWNYDFNACEDFYSYYAGLYLVNGTILADGIAFEYGEAEDYTFTVIQDCPAKITAVNIEPEHGHRCGPGDVTISAQGPPGATYNLYNTEFGGGSLQTNSTGIFNITGLSVGTHVYWVTAHNGSCESVARTPVIARVDPIPTISIDTSSPDICGDEASISITSSGDYEEVSLIDEKFNSGLGVFSNAGTAGYTDGNWINRTNPYQVTKPPYFVLRPAMSSGYNNGNFAASITDLAQNVPLTKQLVLTNPVDATEIEGLKLEFLLYYQSYIGNNPASEYFDVEISTNNGANWTTLERFTSTQGNPGRFVKKEYDLSAYDGMNNLKIRFTNYSQGGSGWVYNIAALDNIRLYGDKPLDSDFSWSGADIDIYDADCTTPYSGETSEVCIKPNESQLESYESWILSATATLSNGCDASADIEITNNTKVWNPAGSNTDWAATNQWKPAVPVPTLDNCVIVKKTVNLNSATDGFAKNLMVKDGGHLVIKGDASLTVNDFIDNQAALEHFVVKHDGNLIQINDAAVNSGEITVEKDFNFSAERKQYNFVSAPVVSGRNMKTSIYTPNPTSVQQYNTATDYFDETVGPYVSGLAYAVKESPGSGETTVSGELMGVPFNGPLNYTLNTSGNKFNLLGNPYPSNLDIKALYDNNNTKIGSTFYFWDNTGNTLHEQQGSGYEGDHYAKYNAVSNTGTAAQCTEYGSGCNKVPDRNVKTGTGFMIEAITGTLNFTNAYRTTAGSIDFFGKPAGFDNQYNRYWLTLTSPSGIQTMMAVVYFDGGTDEFSADDTEGSGGSNGLYSILDTKKLNIQGRAPFRIEDQVPLGYKSFEAGTYIIEVYNSDGIFAASQNIYLIDKLLNKTVKITDKPYKFLTRAGEFNDRFVVVYRPSISTGVAVNASNQILFSKQNNQMVIISTIDKITEIELFNLNSRSVYKKTGIHANEHRIDVNLFDHQIVVVTVKTETGEFVTSKFVNHWTNPNQQT